MIVRSLIPTKIQLYHHILIHLEALDSGEKELLSWCEEGDQLLCNLKVISSREQLQIELEQYKHYFVKKNCQHASNASEQEQCLPKYGEKC